MGVSRLIGYPSTHLFNCQFKCSNQGPVPKQKEFLRSGLSRACTNRVWLLAFFLERAWMAGRALTSSKIYLTFIIHLFQATCHAFFLSHMFFLLYRLPHSPSLLTYSRTSVVQSQNPDAKNLLRWEWRCRQYLNPS